MPPPFAHDGGFFRRLAYLGARHGPKLWLSLSPPLFGVAFALALGEKRRKVRDTLRWVHGDSDPSRERKELYATFIHYAQCFAEGLAAERPEAARARCHVEGEARLRDALGGGRGVVLVTAHVGPWDAAARLLRDAIARDVVVVMQREADAEARAVHDAVREQSGVRVLHVGAHALDGMPLLRELKAGGVVAFQLDRGAPSGRELAVRLFGREISVPEGPFRLAALAGAPIVPLFAKRRGHFDYDFTVYPPISLAARAERSELERAAQTAADAMQDFIAKCPTQWFNF